MTEYPSQRGRTKQLKRLAVLSGLAIVLLFAGTVIAGWYTFKQPAPTASTSTPKATASPEEEKPKPPVINLQPTLESWVAKQKGDFGIVVYDPDNQQVIAQHQGDKQFSTASIYKLYVVYLELIDIQLNERTPDEIIRAQQTRQQCLDAAIRTSDSPCAEALLAELGSAELTRRLKAYGLTGTSFPGFVTTANDAAKLLARLQSQQDFDDTSLAFLLGAMKGQVYRNGLPLGMPEAVVADKVGFSETPHYHDVAIVSLPNGREYVIAVLSQGASSRQVADFAKTVYPVLQDNR